VILLLSNTTPFTLLKIGFWVSTVIDVRLEQPKNASSPMLVTLLGITMLLNLPQFWNTKSPMLGTPLPIVALVRLEQEANASSPMLVTLPGIMTLVSLPQAWNALLPMLVTPAGIVMLARLGQP
jgi:hypothetical protein